MHKLLDNFIILVSFTTVFLCVAYLGQSRTNVNQTHCSTLIKQISDKWRADSLAGNGYRVEVYPRLLECVLDSIDAEFLLLNLGKPTKEIDYMSGGKAYQYNYYDYRYIDLEKSKRKGYGWDFLIFSIDLQKSNRVMRINTGTGEY